jgi:hypothetical protein
MNCSKQRGCQGKAKLGRDYKEAADKFALKHGKYFGVYECPHCGCKHLTTKLHKKDEYPDLVYITSNDKVQPEKTRK